MNKETFTVNGLTMTSICQENEHDKRKDGTYEQEVLNWILDKDLDLYFDIGSFVGYIPLHVRNEETEVVCFEPGEAFDILVENFEQNFEDGYALVNMALSNKGQEVEAGLGGCGFWEPCSGIDVRGSKRVQTLRLDEFLYEKGYGLTDQKVGCKIDCEGMELQILRGVGKYLEDFNFICVEYHPSYVTTKEISKTRGILGRAGFVEDMRVDGSPQKDNCNVCYIHK